MDGFDIDQIDEVIHGRVRLGIMAYLSTAETAEFNVLRTRLQVTDGNLATHLKKLEDAAYIDVEKTFVGRKPMTRIHLNEAGRSAFLSYLDAIGKLTATA